MPSVFTISGPGALRGEKNCKRVKNGKTGCTILLCKVPKSKKHPTGTSFIKGTSECPVPRSRKKKRRKRKGR
jgi:hypothetical protein